MRFDLERPSQPATAHRVAVLLINLGTPDAPTPKAVRRYLAQFLSDPRVVEIPAIVWQVILRVLILPFRGRSSARKYAAVWTPEGSPLRVFTEKQVEGLRHLLQVNDYTVLVDYAMRYGMPGIPDMLNQLKLAGAERVDPALAEWVGEHARFPNSMVDRITPATTLEMAAEVRRDFGVNDRWPVVAEPFSAWVIEDDFADGRPPLEKAGVLVVDDVRPYELMKLRMLNAGHQCLCYFAHLCGFEFVHDAAQDPLFAKYLLSYFDTEAIPTLPPVPGIDLQEYGRTLIERFANPAVRDTVARICAYSSDRIPKWLFPVIFDNLANDGPVEMASAAVASWARYAEGVDEWGEPYEVLDQLADSLVPIARSQHENPNAFIEITAVFGDLSHQHRFVEAYRWALDSLHRKGARATLEVLVQ